VDRLTLIVIFTVGPANRPTITAVAIWKRKEKKRKRKRKKTDTHVLRSYMKLYHPTRWYNFYTSYT